VSFWLISKYRQVQKSLWHFCTGCFLFVFLKKEYFKSKPDICFSLKPTKTNHMKNILILIFASTILFEAKIVVAQKVTIQPNPFQDEIQINLEEGDTSMVDITIRNLAGDIILYDKMKPEKNSVTLIVREFTSGVYLIRISQNEKILSTVRALKE